MNSKLRNLKLIPNKLTYDVSYLHNFTSLGMFAQMLKATISFVSLVCAYIHMEQLSSYYTDFHEILPSIFLKICQRNSSSILT